MKEEIFYDKSDELLYSMALRADHGFGLYEKEAQDKIVARMSQLYDAYLSKKSDKEISEELKFYIVTVKQVREEVNGTGFFKPTAEDKIYYHSFKRK